MRSTSISNIYRIYVPTQEVGGCFDTLHRNNSCRCLVTPIFLLIYQFLYRFSTYWPKTNKFWTLEVDKKSVWFFHHHTIKNFDHRSHPVLAKKGFGRFLVWKKVFNYNNFLYGSIQIEFHSGVFLLVVDRLTFFSKSKWTRWWIHALTNIIIFLAFLAQGSHNLTLTKVLTNSEC